MKLRTLAIIAALIVAATCVVSAAPPVKIGGLFDLTGKAAHVGRPTRDVAQMVVDLINKSGGVNGRKLELVPVDTESEPSKAVVALKKLLARDKVVAVIGPTTTGAAMACISVIEQAQIPMVACVGGDAVVEPVRKWVFKSPQKTSTAVERLFMYLKAHQLNTIGLLAASDKFGQEGEAKLKQAAPRFGIKIVAQESFDPTDVDMTVQVSKVAARKPKAIVVWTIGPAGSIIAKDAKRAGIKIPLFQCHGQPDPNYIKLGGAAVNGTAMPSTKLMAGSQLPATDKQKLMVMGFIKMYKQRGLGEVSAHSGYAWDAIQLIAQGMKRAGTNPKSLREAIERTKGYVGVSGIYNMSPTDHCGLGVDSMVMVQVVNGKWKLVK